MDWDRRRFEDRRGGESYRPAERTGRSPSRGYEIRHRRSPPRTRSPRPRSRSRPQADTWVPPSNRGYGRPRSRSPSAFRRRSRTPPGRNFGPTSYERRRSPPRRFSPRRDERIRSPPQSWRSKSPFSDGRSRDASRARTSPRRLRDTTPGSQIIRPARREGPVALNIDKASNSSSSRQPDVLVSQSPSHAPRLDPLPDGANRTSPLQALSSQSGALSRHSPSAAEKAGFLTNGPRSRSPIYSAPFQRSSQPTGRSPYRDQFHDVELSGSHKRADYEDRMPDGIISPSSVTEKALHDHPSGPRISGNIPTQPKNHSASPLSQPPSGPYHGSRPPSNPHRGPQNVSLLSAPTRPRRGPGSREPWSGNPPVRRGSAAPSHGPPVGPRASFSPPTPGGGFRHSISRQPNITSTTQSSVQRGPNHLIGLSTLIPEGKSLPSLLDPAVEKRLSQLDADKEKLLEQIAETQRTKRVELRDWDRLDRESAICALKSELAEGHLQRMADESIGGGILF
ncbi:uncharacterized protein N7529_002892 [Penicillium soppii]|uniref:uncharacterized protein n=1 Tax=Penicillium soppii TaxID=69789 RepID=UPI002547AA3A|nr:uncharacterized protein N7529_002892 [Penicillium soppii]KAJ5874462.1 hypothetical protein N7529_002892 [Penicillium soppii]